MEVGGCTRRVQTAWPCLGSALNSPWLEPGRPNLGFCASLQSSHAPEHPTSINHSKGICIEPPKEARGHATSDSTHIDGIVLSVTKNNVSARAHESWCRYVYRHNFSPTRSVHAPSECFGLL